MTTVLAQTLTAGFDLALGQLESAIDECPDELWTTDLWPAESPTRTHEGGLRGSAPWLLAHHALVCLDYDLTGERERWVPPAPISDFLWYADPTRVFTRTELLDYLGHCRSRAGEVLALLSDDVAAEPVPEPHRYGGTPYGVLLGSIPAHVVEHATQIRQFLRAPATGQ